MTYQWVVRNPNSWVGTPFGGIHEVTATCGHNHKSVEGALRCKHGQSLFHAEIEDAEGKRVTEDVIIEAEIRIANEKRWQDRSMKGTQQ